MRLVAIFTWVLAFGVSVGAWGWIEWRKNFWRAEALAEQQVKENERAAYIAKIQEALVPFREESDELQATMTVESAAAFQEVRNRLEEIAASGSPFGGVQMRGKDLTHIPFEIIPLEILSVDIIDTSISDLSIFYRHLEYWPGEYRRIGGFHLENSPVSDLSVLADLGINVIELRDLQVLDYAQVRSAANRAARYDNDIIENVEVIGQ